MVNPLKSTIYKIHKRRHERLRNGPQIPINTEKMVASLAECGGIVYLLHYTRSMIRVVPK